MFRVLLGKLTELHNATNVINDFRFEFVFQTLDSFSTSMAGGPKVLLCAHVATFPIEPMAFRSLRFRFVGMASDRVRGGALVTNFDIEVEIPSTVLAGFCRARRHGSILSHELSSLWERMVSDL